MKLQLIRNATLKLSYAGRTILIDPYFAPRFSLPSYTGRSKNPLVDLPLPIDDILDGVELVIVSHLHSDHFDSVAKNSLAKSLPIVCQPGDERAIGEAGFTDIRPLISRLDWQGITIVQREASHGLGPVAETMGSVMGFTLSAEGEPSVYWTGDTVFYPPVAECLAQDRPDVVVTHSCGALWDGDLIVMDAGQTVAAARAAPDALLIAVHMDTLDHATVSRQVLRAAADAAGIRTQRLRIPQDGETLADF